MILTHKDPMTWLTLGVKAPLAVHEDVIPFSSPLWDLHTLTQPQLRKWVQRNSGWFLRTFDEVYAERRPYPDPVAFTGPGIYFRFTDGLDYVGQSNKVYYRLGQHAKDMSYGLPCPFRSFCVVWCPEPILADVEAFYIAKFNPATNRQRPPVPDYLSSYL